MLDTSLVAKICHEVNRTYCASINDNPQVSWEDSPQWQRDSVINGVRYHLENPDAGPSAGHDNWLKEKYADGWVYGMEKDPIAKTHPCCVPYEELHPEQQTKDYLFITIVKACS